MDNTIAKKETSGNLTPDIHYIGFCHLNNMKSALVDIVSNDMKKEIRLCKKVKALFKFVSVRAPMQARA